jgi:hypothetical protein
MAEARVYQKEADELNAFLRCFENPERVDLATYKTYREDAGVIRGMRLNHIGMFVAMLRNLNNGNNNNKQDDTAMTDEKADENDAHIEWALLAVIRRMCLNTTPITKLLGLCHDNDIKDSTTGQPPFAFPHRNALWANLKAGAKETQLLPLCRRVAHLYNTTTCPDSFILLALECLKFKRHKEEFEAFHEVTPFTAATRLQLELVMYNINEEVQLLMTHETDSLHTEKMSWLVVRLSMPLGGPALSEFLVSESKATKMGNSTDWDTARNKTVWEAIRDTMTTLRMLVYEPSNEETDKKLDELETTTKKHEPEWPTFSDANAELNKWMTHKPGSHTFTLPKCFGNSQTVLDVVPWLKEITILVTFAHAIDRLNSLPYEQSFLTRYVLLQTNIDRHRQRWQEQTVTRRMRQHMRCPLILIADDKFAVLHQKTRTEYTKSAAEACAMWYFLCKRHCGTTLDNGFKLKPWAEVESYAWQDMRARQLKSQPRM